jgi:hypothetical protein
MEQHTLKTNSRWNTNILFLLGAIWLSNFKSIFKCCSFFQCQGELDICGCLRQFCPE